MGGAFTMTVIGGRSSKLMLRSFSSASSCASRCCCSSACKGVRGEWVRGCEDEGRVMVKRMCFSCV